MLKYEDLSIKTHPNHYASKFLLIKLKWERYKEVLVHEHVIWKMSSAALSGLTTLICLIGCHNVCSKPAWKDIPFEDINCKHTFLFPNHLA